MSGWDFNFPPATEVHLLSQARLFSVPGRGTPLLFIHGGFHGAWCWAPFLRFFTARGIAAAALDLRGHGGLSQGPAFIGTGVAEMAADVGEATQALGGAVILAGHSLGALVAMAAAEQVRPRGLVLLAPQPPANVQDVRLLPPFPPDLLVAPPPEERARKWMFGGAKDVGGDALGLYLARLCSESPAFLNDLYERRVQVDPAWVKGPVLCLSGGRDDSPLHAAGQDEKIAAFYGAEFPQLPAAGHCLMADATRDTGAAVIADWLAGNNLC